jgi:hypothetical protein
MLEHEEQVRESVNTGFIALVILPGSAKGSDRLVRADLSSTVAS